MTPSADVPFEDVGGEQQLKALGVKNVLSCAVLGRRTGIKNQHLNMKCIYGSVAVAVTGETTSITPSIRSRRMRAEYAHIRQYL